MNNLMNYKGFTAKIEFSADDNVFVGRLIGIDDIVMFEAETVEGLNITMSSIPISRPTKTLSSAENSIFAVNPL